MKTLYRTLLYLALIVWLGAEIFFPIVAAITFQTLRPDTHTAGTIVGHLLRILHGMGLVSGMVALALAGAGSGLGYLQAARGAGAHGPVGADDRPHRLLAVRHHSGDGAGPHRRRRRPSTLSMPPIPAAWILRSCTAAAKMSKEPFCCWGWRRWCCVARAESAPN